jgi:hypothetical protein
VSISIPLQISNNAILFGVFRPWYEATISDRKQSDSLRLVSHLLLYWQQPVSVIHVFFNPYLYLKKSTKSAAKIKTTVAACIILLLFFKPYRRHGQMSLAFRSLILLFL